MDKVPSIQVVARCKCRPFRFIFLSLANKVADLTCPECGKTAVHLDVEWPREVGKEE